MENWDKKLPLEDHAFYCFPVCSVIKVLYHMKAFTDRMLMSVFLSGAEVSVSNHSILAQYCKDHHVGLVIVGPEAPLAAGS